MSGKAVTFIVNAYDGSSSGSDYVAPISYFVAGGARGDDDDPAPALRGDELVDGLVFKDDLRDAVIEGQLYYRYDGAELSASDSSARATLTNELLTRGGWRDHTDGNRVSTTRGDAIDVVYGNYKLVVLGRITEDFDPSGHGGLGSAGNTESNETLSHAFFDASGGHITEGTSTGGKIVASTWKSDEEDGSWQSLRQTDSGDRRTVYTGTLERSFFGPSWTSSIGEGTSAVAIDSGANTALAHAAERPDVTRTTRARSIDLAEKIERDSETFVVSGAFTEETQVAEGLERTTVADSFVSTVAAVTIREDLVADTIEERSAAKTFRLELTTGVARGRVDAILYKQTATLGSLLEFRTYGLHVRAVTPLSVKAFVGMETDFRLGPSIHKNDGVSVRLHATFDLVGYLWGGLTRIFGKKAELAGGEVVIFCSRNHAVSNTV